MRLTQFMCEIIDDISPTQWKECNEDGKKILGNPDGVIGHGAYTLILDEGNPKHKEFMDKWRGIAASD